MQNAVNMLTYDDHVWMVCSQKNASDRLKPFICWTLIYSIYKSKKSRGVFIAILVQ